MAAAKAPPTFENFDVSRLRLNAPKNSKNSKNDTAYISFEDGSPAIFYVPNCRLAHGVSTYDTKTGKSVAPSKAEDNCSMAIDVNENLKYFPAKWAEIENQLKYLIEKDSKNLFGKIISKDKINEIMKKKLKEGETKNEETGEKYNPSISIKQSFNYETGKSITEYLDGQNNNKSLEITYLNASTEIPRGTICNMYLKLFKITLAQGNLYITLYPTQASINRPTNQSNFMPIPIASDVAIGRVRESDNMDIDAGSTSVSHGDTNVDTHGDTNVDTNVDDDDIENNEDSKDTKESKKKAPTKGKTTKK
jgi:hypothetical protein